MRNKCCITCSITSKKYGEKIDIPSSFGKKWDLSHDNVTDFLDQTGLHYIVDSIKHRLGYKKGDSLFIEYNYVTQLLDLNANGYLKSFVFAESGSPDFLNNIKDKMSDIIRKHSNDCHETLYQHKDLFFAPCGFSVYTSSRQGCENAYNISNNNNLESSWYTKNLTINNNQLFGILSWKRSYRDAISFAQNNTNTIESLQENLHAYYHNSLTPRNNLPGSYTYFFTIPIGGAAASNRSRFFEDLKWGNTQNHGVIFLFYVNANNMPINLQDVSEQLYADIGDAARYAAFNYLLNVGYNLREKAMVNASRSAIGSIMSRNGSHNIGSHVLSALSHHVGTMPDDRMLYQYIQQRMDYIANVTTEFPSWTTSTMFVGDMMKTFFSQKHLLEFISESESLHAYRFRDPNITGAAIQQQEGKIRIFIRRVDRKDRSQNNQDDSAEVTNFIHYDISSSTSPDSQEQSVSWDKDVALAIPGGVVGQHAFFTIIENVIRNAAKHGWGFYAEDSKKGTKWRVGKKPRNLDIFISFENKDECIEFTIWDNMSDVLYPILGEPQKGSSGASVRYQQFLTALASVDDNDSARVVEDQVELTGLELTRKEWIRKKSDLNYFDKPQILQTPLTKAEADALRGDEKNDFKSYTPLHMQQQILLAQPLINEQGSLKRESWGMAEMRISAGFLWHYGIEEIGGLKDVENEDDYVIRPVAVNAVYCCPKNLLGNKGCIEENTFQCRDDNNLFDCPIKKMKLYHLGYRFKVHKPREILMVLKSNSNVNPGVAKEYKKYGIYFAYFDENDKVKESKQLFFCDSGTGSSNPVNTFNFDYVVYFDKKQIKKYIETKHNIKQTDQNNNFWETYLPFRHFEFGNEKKYIDNINNVNDINNNIKNLKCAIYKKWLDLLKKNRNSLDRKTIISMQIQTEGSSGGSLGLFTNYDILEYVFRHLYHSVMSRLISGDSDSEIIVRMIAAFPEPYLQLPDRNQLSEGIEEEIRIVLVNICQRIREMYPYLYRLANAEDPDKAIRSLLLNGHDTEDAYDWQKIFKPSEEWTKTVNRIRLFYERLKEDAWVLEFIRRNPAWAFEQKLSEFVAVEDFSEDDMMALIHDEAPTHNSPFHALLDPTGLSVLVKELHAAYRNCDVMLRKNEEYIATLPREYSKEDSAAGVQPRDIISQQNNKLKDVGLSLVSSEAEKPLIRYCRHDKSIKDYMLYAEGLSGSQSYLSQLQRIMHSFKDDDVGMFVRLAENALMRILIIDERISKFLNEHEQMKAVYKAMNISVVKVQDAIPDDAILDVSNEKPDIHLDKLKRYDPEKEAKWDILIIHQGIIDKWFRYHKTENIERLIESLQEKVPYTVIATGRGRPDNVPSSAKILPFSTIESTLFCEYPEKLLLVGTVMNILPQPEEKQSAE